MTEPIELGPGVDIEVTADDLKDGDKPATSDPESFESDTTVDDGVTDEQPGGVG